MSLPSGYRKLKYIESSGTQYVDTNFVPNQDTRIVLKVYFPIAGSNQFLFGTRTGERSNSFAFNCYSTCYRSHYNTYWTNYDTSVAFERPFVIDKNKNVTTLNGEYTVTSDYAEFTCPYPLVLFANNNNGTIATFATTKLYSCQIYDDGDIVRDYIPCIDPSGVVGLYDDVNGAFYSDAAGGAFYAGPIDEALPSGYRELEYIESSGLQYVDTGFKPNQDTRVIMDAQMTKEPGTATAIYFGCRSSTHFYEIYKAGSGANLTFLYNTTYPSYFTVNYLLRRTVEVNKNVATVDGTSITGNYGAFSVGWSLYLGADNAAGKVTAKTAMKIYSCHIYDNGTLVRDYVPCINASGVVGLYDLVNGVFYSDAAGGTFTAGRYIYDESEVTKLEYIESTGEQYIDTGFKANQDTKLVMDVQLTTFVEASQFFFGGRTSPSSNAFCVSWYKESTTYYAFYYNAGSSYTANADPLKRHTITADKNALTANGVSVSRTYAAFQCDYSIYLFATNTAGSAGQYANAKLYSCQIYDNGTLVRDLYPAIIDDTVGLWDAKSGIFYENAGTGAFAAGPQLGISSPQNFAAVIEDGSVFLSWDAVSDAAGYRLYRDLLLLSEQSETSYTDDNTQNWHNYLYSVTAYDAENESTPAGVSVQIRGTDPVLDLITDRTAEDVAAAVELAAMDYKNMTDEQKRLWHSSLKGAYNAGDLNRVETAVEYLADILRSLPAELREHAAALSVAWDKFFSVPYDAGVITPSVKTDWLVTDIQTPEDMERYLANVKLLREVLSYSSDTLPASMENLRWQYANAIEKALVNLDAAIIALRANKKMYIENTAAAWFRSGEIFSGEV